MSNLSVWVFSWLLPSVPSPGSGSPVISTVTPARSMLRNTPASLYRQAGKIKTHTHLKQMTPQDQKSFNFLTWRLSVSVTPRVPDMSAILAPGGRTPRYTHTPRNVIGSLVRHKYTNTHIIWYMGITYFSLFLNCSCFVCVALKLDSANSQHVTRYMGSD